jgi:DNA-binding NarL/FixJ family response regulator
LDRLSARERQVLELMAEGRSNQGISQQLVLVPSTVETHITAIYSKLDLPPTTDDHRRVLAVMAYLDAMAQGELDL